MLLLMLPTRSRIKKIHMTLHILRQLTDRRSIIRHKWRQFRCSSVRRRRLSWFHYLHLGESFIEDIGWSKKNAVNLRAFFIVGRQINFDWDQTAVGIDCLTTSALRSSCLPYVPPGLIFKNSTFCPHSVLMCFVWIWEQTAIISLYSINWLVSITETQCVYCAVRTESLSTVQSNRSLSVGFPVSSSKCSDGSQVSILPLPSTVAALPI